MKLRLRPTLLKIVCAAVIGSLTFDLFFQSQPPGLQRSLAIFVWMLVCVVIASIQISKR